MRYRAILRNSLFLAAAMLMFSLAAIVEAQGPPPPPYMGDGDLYPDAAMNEKDLAQFIEYWKTFVLEGQLNSDTEKADFNDNERIDYDDAAWIIGEYLRLYDTYHTASTSSVYPHAAGVAIAQLGPPVRASSHVSRPAPLPSISSSSDLRSRTSGGGK